ncbi:MAG: hypothetical protein WD509_00550 [Candidatus Paceibacterota bacterium]
MQRIVNHSFFKFFLGFLGILLLSFVFTGYVAQIFEPENDIDPNTQIACQTENNC